MFPLPQKGQLWNLLLLFSQPWSHSCQLPWVFSRFFSPTHSQFSIFRCLLERDRDWIYSLLLTFWTNCLLVHRCQTVLIKCWAVVHFTMDRSCPILTLDDKGFSVFSDVPTIILKVLQPLGPQHPRRVVLFTDPGWRSSLWSASYQRLVKPPITWMREGWKIKETETII